MSLITKLLNLFCLCLILGTPSVLGKELNRELAIRKHLLDATRLNKERIFKYARLSKGASLGLSRELILMEELGLLATIKLDLKASKYIEKGVNVFKDDLVDMALTPDFSPYYQEISPPIEHQTISLNPIKKKWLKLIETDELNRIYEHTIELLDHGLLREKNQNCLTRHFVESIARSLLNLPIHQNKARELGLNDPKALIISFLKIQINSLTWAYSLDKRAFEIQKQNIPLFCQDVPPISYK